MSEQTLSRPNPLRFYTTRQLHELNPHISESTWRHWMATEQLPSRKLGRRRVVTEADLLAFLEGDTAA